MSNAGQNAQFVVPDGYSPPFAIVTETDHTAWIYIATALGLAYILLFGSIRIIVRSSICLGVGLDDLFLAASTIFAVFQACLILAATGDGLGKSITLVPTSSQASAQRLYYAGTLLFVIALGLSKISVILFLLRLTSYDTHRRVFRFIATLAAAWTIGSLFATALQCNLSHPWRVVNEHCPGSRLRLQIICAFDIAIEVSIAGMAVLLVWNLHAPLVKKAAVVFTFAFRLVMIVPIVFRLETYRSKQRNSDFFLAEDLFTVWSQTELSYSIMSATVPTIRIFATTLNTQFGGLTENERAEHSGDRSKHSIGECEYSSGSKKPLRLSTDASGSRKPSSTLSMSRTFGARNRHGSTVSAMNYIEDENYREKSGQRERLREDQDEITPAVPPG